MGGKSSSQANTSTSTIQTDERIAATDSASVFTLDGNNNVVTDHGAVNAAGQLGLEAINTIGQVALKSLTQTQSAVEVLGRNTDATFDFVDTQNRDENSRTITQIMPWLLGGVAVLALTGSLK